MTSKLLRRTAVAAFLVLGTSQGPTCRSNRVGLPSTYTSGIWLVEGSEFNNDDTDWAEDDVSDEKASRQGGAAEEPKDGEEPSDQGSSHRPSSLRGAASSETNPPPKRLDRKELEGIFEGLLQSLNSDNEQLVATQAQDVKRLNELIDRIFVPRLQTTPKYQGTLECLNEALNKDILRGPNKDKRDAKALQQAYNFLRNPPVMLQVPVLFVELRSAADRRVWDDERGVERRRYERRGDPVPERFLLTADEFVARDAEEPRAREEELSEDELASRLRLINGWLKQQFRLRLYYRKRIGTLQGNPQDLLVTFDAGPKHVAVSVEDIEGLSYNAELDPEPPADDAESEHRTEGRSSEL